MRIVTNELLQPTNRNISNVNSTFITGDGPNLSSKIELKDIGIPYDSHYISRIVLPANSENFLLNYGILKNTTFLVLKVTYNGNYDFPKEDDFDPLYRQEKETYNINYYFEGNSGSTLPIGRLLLLSGSYINKLPAIYLNNPLGYDVSLHVLHADIAPPKPIQTSSDIIIPNLFYNNVATDQIQCSVNTGYTGSTQFIITGGIYEYYIPYNSFDNNQPITIIKDVTNIYVYTKWNPISETISSDVNKIILKFLTEFDCNQAHSRMLFALDSYTNNECRYINDSGVYNNNQSNSGSSISGFTGVDMLPPVIYYNSSSYWEGSGTTIPVNTILPLVHDSMTGWTINQLKILFISGVTDSFDGIIPLYKVDLFLYKSGSNISLSGIYEDGVYNIIIRVSDNAGNVTEHRFDKK